MIELALRDMNAFERGLYLGARMRNGWVPSIDWMIESFGVSRATAYRMMRQSKYLMSSGTKDASTVPRASVATRSQAHPFGGVAR